VALGKFAGEHQLIPLADRAIRLPEPRKAIVATSIMILSVALASLGLLAASAAFALGVLLMGVTAIIPPRDLYKAVDWPVIVLLGSLIPVAGAMTSTGTADLLANTLLNELAQGTPVLAMALLLIVTMTLSDFMNNAATAAVMCPIALSGAQQLGVNPDPFLMAVAIGASCAFLTPIGHQNNTLILGPGGLQFGDYWRLGLPMEILVVAVSLPVLLLVWPL
jgi:di/tricarboxylate transporter